jgi:hypothetical protein
MSEKNWPLTTSFTTAAITAQLLSNLHSKKAIFKTFGN